MTRDKQDIRLGASDKYQRIIAGDDNFARFDSYWRSLKGDRVLPLRRDFDPAAIGPLLPNLMVIERVASRYRLRLAGTALTERYSHRLTGAWLDEIPGRRHQALLKGMLDKVTAQRCPLVSMIRWTVTASTAEMSRLNLPFSHDGETVAQIISLLRFPAVAGRNAPPIGPDTELDGHIVAIDQPSR